MNKTIIRTSTGTFANNGSELESDDLLLKFIKSIKIEDMRRLEGSIYNFYIQNKILCKERNFSKTLKFLEKKIKIIEANTISVIQNTKSRVMVITPVYNRAALIEKTLKSISDQTFDDYIYVILDDGSTDDTGRVVSNYIHGRKNWFYLYHDNIGEAETVNLGWSLCNCEYFTQINSDDPVKPDLFSEMVKTLDNNKSCIIAYPDFYIINENDEVIEAIESPDYDFARGLADFSCFAAAPGAFIRKTSINDIKKLKDGRFKHTNDTKMLWNIALRGNFIHVPKYLACWRSHNDGISSNRYEAIDEINIWINEYFNQELPDEIRQVESSCRRSVYNYYAQLMECSGLSCSDDMANYYREKAKLPMTKYVNLQVGDNDLIGNKFNGHDLHIGLRAMGIESSHLVWNKESGDNNTYVIAGEKQDRATIRSHNGYIQRLYDLDNIHNPFIYDIIYNKLFLDADVVHLHLMHNGLWDLNLLPLMSKLKPIVWTVHDMWIATGDDHAIERSDYFFPLNDAKNLDFNWELKKEAIKNSNVTFVVASKYMEQAMNEYSLFKEKKIVYIPFGLDFKIFYPRDNIATREELGFDLSEKLILLRGDGGVRKGLNYIEYIMNTLGQKYKLHFLIVGGNNLVIPPNIKTTWYGWLKDDELMAKLYSVADLFLMPSTRENFGMMAIESMACGTVPIVLDGTALPETVNSPSCGVSTHQDMKEYSDAVEFYLNNTKERIKREKKCLDYVKEKHGMEKYLNSLDELYRGVIDNYAKDNNYERILNKLKAINEIKPRLEPVSADISSCDPAMEPLKTEIVKLNAENDILRDNNKKLEMSIKVAMETLKTEKVKLNAENDILRDNNKELEINISTIYSSKRWRFINRVINSKSYGPRFIYLIKREGTYKASKKIIKKVYKKLTK